MTRKRTVALLLPPVLAMSMISTVALAPGASAREPSDAPPETTAQAGYDRVRLSEPISAEDAASLMPDGVTGMVIDQGGLVGEFYFESSETPEENARKLQDTIGDAAGVEPVASGVLVGRDTDASTRQALRQEAEELPTAEAEAPDLADLTAPGPVGEPQGETADAPPLQSYAPSRAAGSGRELDPETAMLENTYTWDRARGSDPARFPDTWGLEFDFDLISRSDVGGKRPKCRFGTNRKFFATRPDEGNVRGFAVTTNGASMDQIGAYFDFSNLFDDCNRISFGVGIGFPQRIPDDATGRPTVHTMVIADRGDDARSVFQSQVDVASNDCFFVPPSSLCMGLRFDRAFPREFLNGNDTTDFLYLSPGRGLTLPGEYSYDYPGPPRYAPF